MRVVLFESVPNLGLAGDIVDVKPGYYRNYLEPRGFALRETPNTLRLLESKRKKIELALLKQKGQAEDAQKVLSSMELIFKLKAGEKGRLFGSVTNRDIADSLNEKGVEVDRHKIELPAPIKSLGKHTARIRLHPEVISEIEIIVEPENPEEYELIMAAENAAESKPEPKQEVKEEASEEESSAEASAETAVEEPAEASAEAAPDEAPAETGDDASPAADESADEQPSEEKPAS